MWSEHDIKKMKKDIADIVAHTGHTIAISNPVPMEDQPNWNPIMREVVGDMVYNTVSNIPVDIVEHPIQRLDTDLAGDRTEGKCRVYIAVDSHTISDDIVTINLPDGTPVDISNDTTFILDGQTDRVWRMQSSFYRTGELVIELVPRVGE